MQKASRQASRLPTLLLLLAASCLSACAPLLTGTASTSDALKVMKAENARGCIYVRASATPWAQATLLLVGTWGAKPPEYSECWKGLPAGVP